jgi:prepilin-type N-terminal cleavage/methylation domain-containing protein
MFEVNFFNPESRMKHQKSNIKNQTAIRGFTIVECLIGLAISAMLLTALAVAFNASVINFRENEDMFRTMNNARQALTRMTSEIRTAGYLDESTVPSTWYGVAHNATPSSEYQCTLYLPNHDLIKYEFRSADKKLYLVKNATDYTLCNNVTNATFTTTSKDPNNVDAASVLISLTVQSGTPQRRFQRTLAAAAVIRRNL